MVRRPGAREAYDPGGRLIIRDIPRLKPHVRRDTCSRGRPLSTTYAQYLSPDIVRTTFQRDQRHALHQRLMSQATIPILIILLAGGLIAVQGPINATLGRAVGSPVNAALLSFLVGLLALTVVAAVQRATPDSAMVKSLPWWAWVGGLCGAVFVSAAAYAAPRIGVANMLTLGIASQLLMAIILDHTGAFNVPVRSISVGRVGGMVLVIAGALLVRRF